MISHTRVPDGMKKVTHEKHMYEQSYMCFSGQKKKEKRQNACTIARRHVSSKK